MARSKKAEQPTAALATVEAAAPAPVQVYKAVTIQQAITRLEDVRRFIQKGLNQGYQRQLKKLKGAKPTKEQEKALKALEIDYGTIPGVNKKFLLQPGAEKICLWLHVRPQYETTVIPVTDMPGHIEVDSRVKLFAVGSDEQVFSGPLASCSSMESNFRYRWVKVDAKVCTADWRNQVGFPGKQLGTHKCYPVYKSGVKTQDWEWSERHDNPNIWDERNKVRQMAEKRALVKAVRNFGAMSEIFTEDPSEWKLDDESNVPLSEEPEQPVAGRVVRSDEVKEAPVTSEAEPIPGGEVQIHFPSDNPDVALIMHMPAAFLEKIRDIAMFNDVRKLYFVPAPDAAEIQARAQASGYNYSEVSQGGKDAEPVKQPNAKLPAKGMVTNIRKQKADPWMMVLYAGVWCYCYHPQLFEYLSKAVGKECEFVFEESPMPKIGRIRRIGTQEWDEETGLPVIQRERL